MQDTNHGHFSFSRFWIVNILTMKVILLHFTKSSNWELKKTLRPIITHSQKEINKDKEIKTVQSHEFFRIK